MVRTIICLSLWLIAVFACAVVGTASTIPGGPNWLAALLGVVALLSGAYFHAGRCRWLAVFFTYGCLGSLMFIPVMYPDWRDFYGQDLVSNRAQRVSDWTFTIFCIVGVICGGAMCRFVAEWRRDQLDTDAAQEFRGRCRRCGHFLYGEPESCCPECGTPFEATEEDEPENGEGPKE